MPKIETLRRKLSKVESDIEVLKDQRRLLTKEIQIVCDHPRAMKTGGAAWQDWPDYGYEPYVLTCTECGISVTSDATLDQEKNLYMFLLNRVVLNVSNYRDGKK